MKVIRVLEYILEEIIKGTLFVYSAWFLIALSDVLNGGDFSDHYTVSWTTIADMWIIAYGLYLLITGYKKGNK